MTKEEFFDVIKEATTLDIKNKDHWFGNILKAYTSEKDRKISYEDFYDSMKRKLEELPWEMVVHDPRSPIEEEYPIEEGDYLTMLDCNEHEVLVNHFKDKRWSLYHDTHIKWWSSRLN